MEKTINIDGRECRLVVNALLPRIYRNKFGRDLIADMKRLVDSYKKNPDEVNLEVLENICWIMLRAGGEDVPNKVEDWLETLEDSFAVYAVAGDIVDLWVAGQKTTSRPKKK